MDDDEMTRWAYELNEARELAKLSRPGVGNPSEVLPALMNAIQLSSRRFVSSRETADPSQQSLLMQEIIRANSQYLRIGSRLERLPKNAEEDYSVLESQVIRGRIVEIAMDIIDRVDWVRVSPWLDMELRMLLLDAKLEFGRRLPAASATIALQQVATTVRKLMDRVEHCSADDIRGMKPWLQVEAARILGECEPEPPERALLAKRVLPGELGEPWSEYCFALTALRVGVETSELPLRLQNLRTRFEGLSAAEKLGARALLATPLVDCASNQVRRGHPQMARLILQTYIELQGFSIEGTPPVVAYLFAAQGSVYCVISDREECESSRYQLPSDQFDELLNVSSNGEIGEISRIRRNLSTALRPVVQQLARASGPRLHLCPIGICSWVPWHALSTGNGTSLAARRRVSWLSPTRSTPQGESSPNMDIALIMDVSFTESKHLRQLWERSGLDPDRIACFSSESNDELSRESFIRILGTASRLVFFGHGVSDPVDAKSSGIVIGSNTVISTRDLSSESLEVPSEMVLVCCEGARDGIFLSGVSPAASLARLGVNTLVSTLWPIMASDGYKYLSELLPLLAKGSSLISAWDTIASKQTNPARMPFCCVH